jgi:pyruvate/2-oxoglutarate dehydrogenase complex dihydrolipoamide dehydrogenase (E3) component
MSEAVTADPLAGRTHAPGPGARLLRNDRHDDELLANVHPPDWTNPEPRGRYNLVVVGAGTAGLVTAAGAAGLGARVALIERNLMGGDCLNVGCVPSKATLRASHVAADLRAARDLGFAVPASAVANFGAAMERMRRIRARISRHDSARRFRDELGVDVYLGQARFLDSERVAVGDKILRFKKAVVATGARPSHPPIPGLEETGFLTNETVFTLTELPRRIAVIGAGPIGSELAQCFRRFGAEVHLFEPAPHLLPREDADAAAIVERRFREDGVQLHLATEVTSAEKRGGDRILSYVFAGTPGEVAVDEILVGVGRIPNLDGLGLDEVGVAHDLRTGVKVDDTLRTTNPRIYAAGDVCMSWKFTHAADFAARIVIQNALFGAITPKKKLSALRMPWCTYTDPEVAHVGLYEREARERGIEIATFQVPLSEVDRAITDGEEDGFVKLHVRKGGDQIVGATIVAKHAGDLISEVTLAMNAKVGLGRLASVIHPYPTQAEALRKAGDAFNRTRLTPLVKRLFATWLGWTR